MDSTKRVLNMKKQEFKSAAKQWYRDYQTAKQYNEFSTFVESLKRDGNTPLLESIQQGITGITEAHNLSALNLIKRDMALCEAYENENEQEEDDLSFLKKTKRDDEVVPEKANADDDDEANAEVNADAAKKAVDEGMTEEEVTGAGDGEKKEFIYKFGSHSPLRKMAGQEYEELGSGQDQGSVINKWTSMMLPGIVKVAEMYGDPEVAEEVYSGLRAYVIERVRELAKGLKAKDGVMHAPDFSEDEDGNQSFDYRPIGNVDGYMRSQIIGPFENGRYILRPLTQEARKIGEKFHNVKKKFQQPGVLHKDPVFKTGQPMQMKPEMLSELKEKGDISNMFDLSTLVAKQKELTQEVDALVKDGTVRPEDAAKVVTSNLMKYMSTDDNTIVPKVSPAVSKDIIRTELMLAGLMNQLKQLKNPEAEDLSQNSQVKGFHEKVGLSEAPKMSEDDLVKAIDETKAKLDTMPKLGDMIDGMNAYEVNDFIQHWEKMPSKGKIKLLADTAAGKEVRTSLLPWLSPDTLEGSKIWDKMTLQDYKGMTGSLSGAASLDAPTQGEEGEGDNLEGKISGTDPSKDFTGSVSQMVEDLAQDIDRINATAEKTGGKALTKSQTGLLKLLLNEPEKYIRGNTETGTPEYMSTEITDALTQSGLPIGDKGSKVPLTSRRGGPGQVTRTTIQRAWADLFDIIDNSTTNFDKYRRLHDAFVSDDEDGNDASLKPYEGLSDKVPGTNTKISGKEQAFNKDLENLYGSKSSKTSRDAARA